MILHDARTTVYAEPLTPGCGGIDLAEMVPRPVWHTVAACRSHPHLSWFPAAGESTVKQQEVCATCVVRSECAEAAVGEEHGIWAGRLAAPEPVVWARTVDRTRVQRAEVLVMRRAHPAMTRAAIAAEVGVTTGQVTRWLKRRR